MPDAFLDPILQRIAREQRAGMRIGTLTAIDAGDASVTVSLAGDSVPGVRWVGSYTPVVDDMVVVSRVEAMWVVLGKLSKQLGAATVVYDAYTLLPFSAWRWSSVSGWTLTNDGTPYVEQRGSAGSPQDAGMILYAGMNVPDGATATSARLTLVRGHPIYDSGAPLVSPVIYGTAQSVMTTPTGSPSMVGGYGPWRPGTLTHEQGATWDLPSTWFTALAAGTLTGFVFYATAAADEMTILAGASAGLSGSLQVNYSIPA